jgi:hypothetical protein
VIFLDTNVISETLKKAPDPGVLAWLSRFDVELALSTVAIAEIAYGIEKIRPDQRATRLAGGLEEWRKRFADRIFAFTEPAALVYGAMMGEASRSGRPMSIPDAMIAAIARVNGGKLATQNRGDFGKTGLELVSPWDF